MSNEIFRRPQLFISAGHFRDDVEPDIPIEMLNEIGLRQPVTISAGRIDHGMDIQALMAPRSPFSDVRSGSQTGA
ncbi:MAG TPA: hypothetical protein VG096_13765 [Bryobacteraceae bacterium]|jgi:hypothetical protein|nr:hypothetical protein [Bryobacteraceae bacterium]